jgi:hypothetical protein
MSVPVVLCPHPPLLLRELTGATDVAADLRAACLAAVRGLLEPTPDTVVVVGGAASAGRWDAALPPDVRRFGTTADRTPPGAGATLPLSLGVGRRLLDEVGWVGTTMLVSLSWDAAVGELDALVGQLRDLAGRSGSLAVLLLGDGSTRRGDKAPGFLDPRAFPFDDAVAQALSEGDARALRALDVDLARDLMVGGRSVFRLLGTLGLPGGPETAALTYRDDPFGVSYFVARWSLASLSASG